MRNLIAFLQRFRIFLVFLILQIVALTSYFSTVSYPRTKLINSSSVVFAGLLDVKHDFTKHFSLEEDNIRLQTENVILRKNLLENYIPINRKTVKIEDTVFQQQYEYIPAKIINGNTEKANNYFTINAGSSDGIEKDMGVISSDGIVGKVYDVSKHYSVVKTILTDAINISAQVEGINAHGLLKWNHKSVKHDAKRIMLTGISNDIRIIRGSRVYTRGSSGLFPKNHTIGVIETIKSIEGRPLWNITIRLNNDLRTLESVYVVKNLMKIEQKQLEANIPEN